MFLILGNDSTVTAYATIGKPESSIEYNGDLPDDFESNFKPKFYLLQNDEIVANPNYEAPVFELPETSGPTTEQQMINQLGLQVATLTAGVNQLKGGVSNV